jgi:drug/metabolite transporter (DMT)-like permease
MHDQERPPVTGITYALVAAILFGVSTPIAKVLLGRVDPVVLASLLYLGSGMGLTLWILAQQVVRRKHREAPLTRADLPWLAPAILCGGVAGPILLMLGLAATPASSASLLLNLEGVLTALLAWFVFRENFDRRIALGMMAIVAGGVVLSWAGRPVGATAWGPLAVAGACLCWAIDNNLTRKVSGGDPVTIAAAKGWVAGMVNLSVAWLSREGLPGWPAVLAAASLGFVSYGVSLVCFVLALRFLGTARTGAYFSLAPFIGAAVAVLTLRESISLPFSAAAGLMGLGLWLHLTERHEHEHFHEPMEHDHLHVHDEHHQHEHAPTDPPGEPHSHPHRHEALRHTHPHYPDLHHRHSH